MGHTATKFGATAWGTSNTGTKDVGGTKQRKKEEGDNNKKSEKKKDPTVGKKKPEKIRTMSSERIDLVVFPEGLRARPLDQRKFLIRST